MGGQQRLVVEQDAIATAIGSVRRAIGRRGMTDSGHHVLAAIAHHAVHGSRCRQHARHERRSDNKRHGQQGKPGDELPVGSTSLHAIDQKAKNAGSTIYHTRAVPRRLWLLHLRCKMSRLPLVSCLDWHVWGGPMFVVRASSPDRIRL